MLSIGPDLDIGSSPGQTKKDVPDDSPAMVQGLFNEDLQEGTADFEVGDNPIPQRLNDLDMMRSVSGHLFGLHPYGQRDPLPVLQGGEGGLLEIPILIQQINHRVGGSQVNGQMVKKRHGCCFLNK